MRKVVLALAAVIMATPAMADWRHHYRAPPPRVQQHHRGINPWVAGAIGLGVLGAGSYYYYNNRRCWNEPMVDYYGRQVYDNYGRPMVQRFCE
jgi:multisubunit Na+/H+ antiporter MnhB subunit